jgi:hypothetical protein
MNASPKSLCGLPYDLSPTRDFIADRVLFTMFDDLFSEPVTFAGVVPETISTDDECSIFVCACCQEPGIVVRRIYWRNDDERKERDVLAYLSFKSPAGVVLVKRSG